MIFLLIFHSLKIPQLQPLSSIHTHKSVSHDQHFSSYPTKFSSWSSSFSSSVVYIHQFVISSSKHFFFYSFKHEIQITSIFLNIQLTFFSSSSFFLNNKIYFELAKALQKNCIIDIPILKLRIDYVNWWDETTTLLIYSSIN